jgi:hypothetical protein
VKLFSDKQERGQAVCMAATVAMHAVLSHRGTQDSKDDIVKYAFELGRKFVERAEQETANG